MEKLLEKIHELYGIKATKAEKVSKGFLSENYIVFDGVKKYFLKKYRFDNRERIVEIHSAKKYFADGGITVILPIPLKNGDGFFFFENGYYTLFPFVEGKQFERGELSETAIISLGETLGQIHLLGKKSMLPIKEMFTPWDKEKTLEKIKLIETKIAEKTVLDEFDKRALENIELKKKLVSANSIKYEDLGLPSNHLIHGDYLDHNVFFGEDDCVDYVFDFEKTEYSPRTYELFRSMMYFLGEHISSADITRAKLYFNSYVKVYPMSKVEIKKGLQVFYLKSIHGLWVESEHYLKNNNRIDAFLYPDSERIKYVSENLKVLQDLFTK